MKNKPFLALSIVLLIAILIFAFWVSQANTPKSTPIATSTPTPSPTSTPSITPTDMSITVSGRASSAALSEPEITSIQKIEFSDVQTGVVTSFNFNFPQQSNNPFGNYTVTLENGHTYNVTISYYRGFIVGNMDSTSDYFTTFTVNATAGQTAITENFT